LLEVKGSFRVNKIRMIQSNIQYAVLFLTDRLVFVKIGGQFADGGFVGTAVGGALGGALGGLVGSAVDLKIQKSATDKKNQKVKALNELSVEELLGRDKQNFEIYYGDIIKIEMKHSVISLNGNRTGVFNILGKKLDKFDIAPGQDYQECERVVSSILPGKINPKLQ
jgi:hypothetical protein